MATIATSVELAMSEKLLISSERDNLIKVMAMQIHRNSSTGISQQVKQAARILHTYCYIENARDPEKELDEKTIETKLYQAISLIVKKEANS